MKKLVLICAVLLLVVFAASVLPAFAEAGDGGIYDKLVRFHVVANSDSDADQSLKQEVRDAVLALLQTKLGSCSERGEAVRIIEGAEAEIEETARAAITGAGYDYPVRLVFAQEYCPRREYENFTLPAGRYLALRVIIGSGEGHNFFCVLFPRLCLNSALGSEKAAKAQEEAFIAAGFTPEEYRIITEEEGDGKVTYRLRFRLIEIIEDILSRFSANKADAAPKP